MAINNDDLNAFHEFAVGKIDSSGVESFHQLAELWTMEHPTAHQLSEDVRAVRAAIRDMESGEQGRPAAELIEELRQKIARSDEG